MTGYFYMVLLALQFGFQPLLTKAYAPKTIVKSTYVIMLDVIRLVTCVSLLVATGSWSSATSTWTLTQAFRQAGLPAALYALQNFCSLTAYQNLQPITYNVLNQTKTLSAAVWCYLLMGKRQSRIQILSLFVLLSAALVMESASFPDLFRKRTPPRVDSDDDMSVVTSGRQQYEPTHWRSGVGPVLVASLTSGLAGALTQKSLQMERRNNLLLSTEMAAFSSFIVIASLTIRHFVFNSRKNFSPNLVDFSHWTRGWTTKTWIPLTTNSLGGVIVGMVK